MGHRYVVCRVVGCRVVGTDLLVIFGRKLWGSEMWCRELGVTDFRSKVAGYEDASYRAVRYIVMGLGLWVTKLQGTGMWFTQL